MAETNKENMVLTYKGKPMQRRGNVIYFGSFQEDYIIQFTITDTKKEGELDVATNVIIELKDNVKNTIVKKAERENLFKAIDIAEFWLLDALGEIE